MTKGDTVKIKYKGRLISGIIVDQISKNKFKIILEKYIWLTREEKWTRVVIARLK